MIILHEIGIRFWKICLQFLLFSSPIYDKFSTYRSVKCFLLCSPLEEVVEIATTVQHQRDYQRSFKLAPAPHQPENVKYSWAKIYATYNDLGCYKLALEVILVVIVKHAFEICKFSMS